MNPPKMNQKVYTPEDSTAETWMLGVRATAMIPHEVKRSKFRKVKKKYQKNLPADIHTVTHTHSVYDSVYVSSMHEGMLAEWCVLLHMCTRLEAKGKA